MTFLMIDVVPALRTSAFDLNKLMRVRYDMVACFVVRPGEKQGAAEFLQLRRAAGDFMGGAWSTVRGRIEPDE